MASLEDGLPSIREVLEQLGHRPNRALGQHFIRNLNFTRHIARQAGELKDCDVLEIGSGPGGLTRALLLEGARRVFAVERDHRCLVALDQISRRWPGRLEVLPGDALRMDLCSLADSSLKIVSNLPYGIAAPLLVKWVSVTDWPPWWSDATLMIQREMAERIVSKPSTRAYGRLSVLLQWRTQVRIIMRVPEEVFVPPPRVESCLIQIKPRIEAESGFLAADLSSLTAATFGNRRKMLRRSLTSLVNNPAELLGNAGIDATLRADALSVSDYCRLARLLANDHRQSRSTAPVS